jgi:hypothetical protein
MFNKTKFPGKPSKLVNKKRVSVLSYDNNCDKRVNDHCEIDSEKNLASPKHEHGYQVGKNRGRFFAELRIFMNFLAHSRQYTN